MTTEPEKKKRGRPRSRDPARCQVHVQVTPAFRAKLITLARHLDVSVSQAVRVAIQEKWGAESEEIKRKV